MSPICFCTFLYRYVIATCWIILEMKLFCYELTYNTSHITAVCIKKETTIYRFMASLSYLYVPDPRFLGSLEFAFWLISLSYVKSSQVVGLRTRMYYVFFLIYMCPISGIRVMITLSYVYIRTSFTSIYNYEP